MVHGLFSVQVTRQSIRLRWPMNYSEIPQSNIPYRMLRTTVVSVYKCRYSTVQQHIELKDKALEACEYQKSLRALSQLVKHLKIFEHYHAATLLEVIETDPDNLEELVDQFLWINTSLGNWSYVLRALEFKVKLAGKEKGELNYEEMMNSLESAA